ncbi:unnamed protein product [Protopolystoma xenopodis]|uniref:Uncharacterized protein n=1 Tax=Protopolystoma xenopodis TaxID=117903 RepID=A0A3S5ADY8_9PLAT|nr:unnamed protein product [Protopolystoma xenopodis]
MRCRWCLGVKSSQVESSRVKSSQVVSVLRFPISFRGDEVIIFKSASDVPGLGDRVDVNVDDAAQIEDESILGLAISGELSLYPILAGSVVSLTVGLNEACFAIDTPRRGTKP